MNRRTVLSGTGMYVPELVVDNAMLSRVMDTSDEWIRQRTGIVRRHFAGLDEATSDLAVHAASAAIADAGIAKETIEYVVFATMTPDHYFPGAGAEFQGKFGLGKVPALDIRQQCAGFLYGLQLADAMIRAGQYETVLVIGAEVHAGFMPWDWKALAGEVDVDPVDYESITRFRDRTVLFGDGAGAFVLRGESNASAADAGGFIDVMVHSDGRHWDKMWVPAAGSAYKPYIDDTMRSSGAWVPIVEGREVFKVAVTLMPEAVQTILARNGLDIADVRLLVMHQANLRINEMVQKRLDLSDDRVYNNIQNYGNTTAATLPMAFHEARTARDLKPGDLVCFVALGSGLNWGAALYRV